MTLAERIAEAERRRNECAVNTCERGRVPDSLFCRDHLREMWANRLERQPDGTYVPRLVAARGAA